ncbi:MAG: DUF3667 domain-containing protein, partial [Gammaproteobacteria bacterium]|nr:DUF3667 domain-containing protein [Gammaproteobacteria bacterium]MBV9723732.1 DUF3667 domain-containing protein [Gammaproteobacteria bacterium]
MNTAAAAGPVPEAQTAAGTSLVAQVAAMSARCENCSAVVTGRYCPACGQRLEPPVHSLWHFAQVAMEDLTHADSRVWRTLGALLFRPGYLTREFLSGRRARYLPPVRLYLVISVVFFLWAAATHEQVRVVQVDPSPSGPARTVLTPLDESTFGAPLPGESAEQHAERICAKGVSYEGPWHERVQPAAQRACVRLVLDKGHSLPAVFLHNVPRAMFIFLPLLAGAMMLMYWRPRHYYVEHLLLFVHNHAFVFLLVMLAGLASALLRPVSGWISAAVTLYIAWYAYRSMRVVYGQGPALTLGKL